MISQKLQEAINAQIVAEMWSANLYLSMSYFFAAKGYEGFASWMKAQAHEESDHADVLAQYVMKRGGQAKVGHEGAPKVGSVRKPGCFQIIFCTEMN